MVNLTTDSDSKVDTPGMTETQLAIESVVKKVFAHYSISLWKCRTQFEIHLNVSCGGWGKLCHQWVAQNTSKHLRDGRRESYLLGALLLITGKLTDNF